MKNKFYSWLFKKLYFRVIKIEQQYFHKGNLNMSNECIRLQNLMNYLKEELITGKIKWENQIQYLSSLHSVRSKNKY